MFHRLLPILSLSGMLLSIGFAGWVALDWAGVALMMVGPVVALLAWPLDDRASAGKHPGEATPRKPFSPSFDGKLAALARSARLASPPEIAWIGGMPNAYLSGNGKSPKIILAESLHDLLSERLLLAVIAHELAHARAGDRWLLRTGERWGRFAYIASAVVLLVAAALFVKNGDLRAPNWAYWVLALAPAVMSWFHLVAMRSREFAADREAGRLTGDPTALTQALARIQFAMSGPDLRQSIEEFSGIRGRGWWRTHPPIEQRIERLQRTS